LLVGHQAAPGKDVHRVGDRNLGGLAVRCSLVSIRFPIGVQQRQQGDLVHRDGSAVGGDEDTGRRPQAQGSVCDADYDPPGLEVGQ
jgi:hypothetical protein